MITSIDSFIESINHLVDLLPALLFVVIVYMGWMRAHLARSH